MSAALDEFKVAILLATIDNLETPHHLTAAIASAAGATSQRLVIVLFSRLFDPPRNDGQGGTAQTTGVSRTGSWDEVQRLLTFVYVQATKVAQDMGKVLIDIDVLLKGPTESLPETLGETTEVSFRVEGDDITAPLPGSISSLRQIVLPPTEAVSSRLSAAPVLSGHDSYPPFYPVVALGGTFDHLHAGHKILLSMAAWICSEKVIVGVTGDDLLKKKSNRHVLEDLQTRFARTRAFLTLFRSELQYDLVAINDVYGPTGWDPNIQALVVSKETLPGAMSIDKERASKSLPSLRTFVIDVISSSSEKLDHEDAEMLKQTKMSSTFIREWIAKNQGAITDVRSSIP
ncbi:Nucleotidylyl transferase [Leucogyrophana mollusca]|uniref:Nucleotidylyl transferase n=1 Tax=Leucogyrophana mollusca TaxID=85980 RepID=A0ACB8BMB0_9AGAM|nr:Nucleotidylyl transferase [Leucogyrophana mollusca]